MNVKDRVLHATTTRFFWCLWNDDDEDVQPAVAERRTIPPSILNARPHHQRSGRSVSHSRCKHTNNTSRGIEQHASERVDWLTWSLQPHERNRMNRSENPTTDDSTREANTSTDQRPQTFLSKLNRQPCHLRRKIGTPDKGDENAAPVLPLQNESSTHTKGNTSPRRRSRFSVCGIAV